MVSVNELIGQLLLQHNCVVIPGFGGFVASQSSSVIDFNNGTMTPPKKSLLFNKQLINNDGLLISELSISNVISFEKAQEEVQQSVASWNNSLRSGGQIDLPNVGRLFFDAENNICFEQDRFFNLLLQSYGLSKIHFVAEEDVQIVERIVAKETQAAQEPVVSIEPIAEQEVRVIQLPSAKPKVWRYVAAACLLPIAFYSIWIPVKTDVLESGMISIKDFNPFYTKGEAVYKAQQYDLKQLPKAEKSLKEEVQQLPENVAVYSYKFDQDTYVPVRLKVGENPSISTPEPEVVNIIPETLKKPEVIVGAKAGAFSYIVGCFSNEANASNLVKKLKDEGLNASLAGNAGGLTRVSAGSASSQQEIQAIASKAQALGFTGWVLKN